MYCDGWAFSAARRTSDSWVGAEAASGCTCRVSVWGIAGGAASEAVGVRVGDRRSVEVAMLRVTRGRKWGVWAARRVGGAEARREKER